MKYQIFTSEQLFKSIKSMNEFKANILLDIERTKVLLDDQPGAIRYNLDDLVNTSFIHLFQKPPISTFLVNYFKTNTVYIRYIRFRNPVLNEGEQDFHMDWYAKCKILRLELFFIIDTMNINNGCIEIIDDNIVKSILMPE